MRIGVYGNNLNVGYFFAREFVRHGHQAVLFRFDEPFPQDRPEWWLDGDVDRTLIREFGKAMEVWSWLPLTASRRVRELFRAARQCDALVFMQDGPALFAGLSHPNKVFVSQGGDLQNFPFALEQYLNRSAALSVLSRAQRAAIGGPVVGRGSFVRATLDGFRSVRKHALRQVRQRRGLRQCRAWVCTPNQSDLVQRLGYDMSRVTYLPLPYFGELNPGDAVDPELMRRYLPYDLVFVHPTRQMFLSLDGNPYLKGNDKLIEGFARFLKRTTARIRLLLVRKGRPADIAESERRIRDLQLAPHVEWFDEMSNTLLKKLYRLPNAVVCDQFDPSTGYLGAIGREASVFGCPVITCFEPGNALFFGADLPGHVFPAKSAEDIEHAMHVLASAGTEEQDALRASAKSWSQRHLLPDSLIPRYLDVLNAS